MLVREQEPYPPSNPPAGGGKMVQIPYVTVPLYAALLIALGWFGGEQWRNKPVPQPITQPITQPVAHAALVPLKRLPSRRWMTGRAGRLRRVRRENKNSASGIKITAIYCRAGYQ